MKRLKRSRGVKITSLVLLFLLIYTVCGNTALLYTAYSNNMMNVNREAFNNKIYSFFAEQTANDAIRYFYIKESKEQAENENQSYYDSEIELYESKYSRENANAAFLIRDENGKTILKNYDLKDYAYRYDRTFTHTVTPSVRTKDLYRPEYASEEPTIDEETDTTEATEAAAATPEQTVPAEPASDASTNNREEVSSAYQETTQHVLQPADESSAAAVTVPPEELTTATYPGEISFHIEDGHRDDGRLFRFVYGTYDGLRDDVLAFCLADYNGERAYELNYADDNFSTYFQDDFGVSANGVVYYEGVGSLRQAYEWNTYPEEYQKVYSVTVLISKDMTAKDMYRFAAGLSNAAYAYKNAAIPLSVVFVLLGVALYIFLLYAAGWTKKADAPVCRGWHRFPFDLSCLIFATLLFILFAILPDAVNNRELFVLCFLTIPQAAILFICFTESLAVRIKTRSIKNSLLVVKCFRLLKKGISVISTNLKLLWKVGVYYIVSGILTCLLIGIFHNEAEVLLIGYFLFKLAELPVLIICTLNAYSLQKGAKKLAEGNTENQITGPLMFGEFKKHADSLNAVNVGINNAVAERLRSERMKTELITNVSHDLKTPLTSIVNYIDLLKKEDVQNPQAQEYIDVIDRQAQRLKKLTTDIVDASKAATGNILMQMERTDLSVMLQQVSGEYAEKLAAKDLQPVLTLPEEESVILADGRYLWRVFDNLMNNVCKYAMPGTRVYLTLANEGAFAQVIFRNISGNELNISPAELTERFVRGDVSRNTEGAGLGLSIAKSLTENMGGSFEIGIDGDLFKVTLRFPRQFPQYESDGM